MSGIDRRFRPDELTPDEGAADVPTTAEVADALAMGRELERFAVAEDVRPSPGFADRVMGAIADEPLPAPVVAAGAAARGARLGAMLAAFGDLWRVAWTGGRPLAVRAQALAIVLVILVVAGSVTSLAAVGALNVLTPNRSPDLTPAVSPSPSVAPTPTLSPSPSPSPTESAEPSDSAGPSESTESSGSAEPSETPEATSGGTGATPRPTPEPTATPKPTETPEPSQTPRPTDTPEPTGTDDHDGGDETPAPTT